MNPFEKRLKQIPLSKPSQELRTQLFGKVSILEKAISWFNRPIQLRWAMAMALFMGILGYSAATLQSQIINSTTLPDLTYEVRIVENQSKQQNFDLSQEQPNFLSGLVTASVEVNKEL